MVIRAGRDRDVAGGPVDGDDQVVVRAVDDGRGGERGRSVRRRSGRGLGDGERHTAGGEPGTGPDAPDAEWPGRRGERDQRVGDDCYAGRGHGADRAKAVSLRELVDGERQGGRRGGAADGRSDRIGVRDGGREALERRREGESVCRETECIDLAPDPPDRVGGGLGVALTRLEREQRSLFDLHELADDQVGVEAGDLHRMLQSARTYGGTKRGSGRRPDPRTGELLDPGRISAAARAPTAEPGWPGPASRCWPGTGSGSS